jgi:hypothetical protein
MSKAGAGQLGIVVVVFGAVEVVVLGKTGGDPCNGISDGTDAGHVLGRGSDTVTDCASASFGVAASLGNSTSPSSVNPATSPFEKTTIGEPESEPTRVAGTASSLTVPFVPTREG